MDECVGPVLFIRDRPVRATFTRADVRYDCCSCTRQVGWRALRNTGAQGRKEQAFALLFFKNLQYSRLTTCWVKDSLVVMRCNGAPAPH